jgi:plastocyanin
LSVTIFFQHRRWLSALLLMCSGLALAQEVTVTARVALLGRGKGREHQAGVVIWLTPTGNVSVPAVAPLAAAQRPRLIQRNKSFDPHLLVVPVGSLVEFPNRDPFFHNVFSLFEGKSFDLGLYEAGSTRDVLFDKPGISYIFCNIHAEMSAVVVAVPTPYYAISDRYGQVIIPHVPAGHYIQHVWYEDALPEQLNTMTREVTLSESNATLGLVRLNATGSPQAHKNKYGRDYDPPTPDSPAYARP